MERTTISCPIRLQSSQTQDQRFGATSQEHFRVSSTTPVQPFHPPWTPEELLYTSPEWHDSLSTNGSKSAWTISSFLDAFTWVPNSSGSMGQQGTDKAAVSVLCPPVNLQQRVALTSPVPWQLTLWPLSLRSRWQVPTSQGQQYPVPVLPNHLREHRKSTRHQLLSIILIYMYLYQSTWTLRSRPQTPFVPVISRKRNR